MKSAKRFSHLIGHEIRIRWAGSGTDSYNMNLVAAGPDPLDPVFLLRITTVYRCMSTLSLPRVSRLSYFPSRYDVSGLCGEPMQLLNEESRKT